jgi:lysozyme family protein
MFNKIMQFILQWEGGYVNDPKDPGGETKYGISKRAHPNEDIKGLTKERAFEIYRKNYWSDKWEGLGFPLAACMMDTAVNMGPARAQKRFEMCGGSYVQYLQLRIARYKELIKNNPSLAKFEKGWMNRVTDLRRFIDEYKDTDLSDNTRTGGGV